MLRQILFVCTTYAVLITIYSYYILIAMNRDIAHLTKRRIELQSYKTEMEAQLAVLNHPQKILAALKKCKSDYVPMEVKHLVILHKKAAKKCLHIQSCALRSLGKFGGSLNMRFSEIAVAFAMHCCGDAG